MNDVWVKSSYDYGDIMARDLESLPEVTVIDGVALQGWGPRTIGATIRRVAPGFAAPWARWCFCRLVARGIGRPRASGVIVLFDSSPHALDAEFLAQLRRRRPEARLVGVVYNVLVEPGRAEFFQHHYDAVFSFDPRDAHLHGFRHFEGIYSDAGPLAGHVDAYDVIFVGLDKGRLDMLLEIYRTLTEASLRCRFHVTTDRQDVMSEGGFLVSKDRLSYSESTALARSSRCILDLVPAYQTGLSLRCVEAVVFGTRLLSNSTALKHTQWFERAAVSVFEAPEGIDLDFVADPSPAHVDYRGEFSAVRLLERIRGAVGLGKPTEESTGGAHA